MVVNLAKSRNYNNEQRTMNYELLFKTNPIKPNLVRLRRKLRTTNYELRTNYVFIESHSIKERGRKTKTGSHAQNSGITLLKTTSLARILHIKVVTKHIPTIAKLIITADFIDFGSRQTRSGRHTISIKRFIIGSVMRKCFWLKSWAWSLIFGPCFARIDNCRKLIRVLCSELRLTGISFGVMSLA